MLTNLCAFLFLIGIVGDDYVPGRPQSIWGMPDSSALVGHAWLEGPGGRLYFGLELDFEDFITSGQVRAWIINGKERIEVPADFRSTPDAGDDMQEGTGELTLRFDHYDSIVTAKITGGGPALGLIGEWKKRRGRDEWLRLPFRAEFSDVQKKAASSVSGDKVAGRWAVKFATEVDPAVGVFEALPDGFVAGTFLTSTGDYRYLAGELTGDMLRLSSFDGAHAFLFKAKLQSDSTLNGEFWSGDKHHETWTAERDTGASLPNPLSLAKVNEKFQLTDLVFPDPDGNRKSLGDSQFSGKARIIQVFGSWCPNCHDEAAFLAELDAKYRLRGLSILGLAFELTGDEKLDATQVRRYAAHHKINYPLLIAGTRDKAKAAAAFPLLDRIMAYPTTIFLNSEGRVRAVHTGYSGPATGEAHSHLRKEFEDLIEELLSEQSKE